MMPDPETVAACKAAIGRKRFTTDTMAPEPAAKLAVLLNGDVPDDLLPPAWHWVYFNRAVPEADQGPDMHERTGIFLPPAPFHRRMWAAGDITVRRPLRLGRPAHRQSVITDVSFKEGRGGAMCFATVAERIEQDGELRLDESKTIVYRDRGRPETALRGPGDPVPEGFFVHSDAQLFFYSAVTHNGHRIHWDRTYCAEAEGYPDPVVHGPLMATELCDAMRDGIAPCRFAFRAQAPVFTTSPVRIEPGAPAPVREGRILRSDGITSMTATLTRL